MAVPKNSTYNIFFKRFIMDVMEKGHTMCIGSVLGEGVIPKFWGKNSNILGGRP
jgi:hypothetical protein